jgi:hypothetical protein
MVAMAELHAAHTAELDAATLTAARALLYDVFDNMTDHDWEHALVWEGADLIGHASVIQRRLLHRGRPRHPPGGHRCAGAPLAGSVITGYRATVTARRVRVRSR